jgi:hypothetical protein
MELNNESNSHLYVTLVKYFYVYISAGSSITNIIFTILIQS